MAFSLGAYWDAARGRPAGFDLLRVMLALSVVLWHAFLIPYGEGVDVWFQAGPLRPLIFSVVPAFFALSGFLVAGSLERNNLVSFLTLRGLRIFPALTAEVMISAFVIGALLTSWPLSDYFRSGALYAYFFNIVGYIHYQLPGVFEHLPISGIVNSQLWPIPFELDSYLALAALALVGLTRRPKLFFALVSGANLLLVAYLSVRQGFMPTGEVASGRLLILCFLYGVILYQLRACTIRSLPLFLVCLAVSAASVYFTTAIFLMPLPLAYVTVCIGVQSFRLPLLSQAANYSYGIYLYGFPVQQAVCQLFPGHRSWYFNFFAAGGITLLVAMLSWHLLESRIMARRKAILAAVNKAIEAPAALMSRFESSLNLPRVRNELSNRKGH